MTVAHDTLNDKYDIVELTKEELSEIGEMINYCPLPLKRKFYGLKKDIETTLK
jgi:hypothetical protein